MKRFSTFSEEMPHEFNQAEIAGMSDAELIKAIADCGSWDADLLADLIWRAYPEYDQPWEVGDPVCYAAAEKLGFDLDSGEEITLQISRINIKTETFGTPWEGQLYCVDICEDAEERSAWLYNANYGVKSLMWGEEVKQQSHESFINLVFSNLPEYIKFYQEEYED